MNLTSNEERDRDICSDYATIEVAELARIYGLSTKRIQQILAEHDIDRRPRLPGEKKIISQVHSLVGVTLFSHREARGIEAYPAANTLGWSVIKLRRIEQGLQEIELLD
jgi:hypothetical protein